MSVRIDLLCHAATSAVRTAAFPVDEPLEEGACRKLSALSGALRAPDKVWTSPALRARQTAESLGLEATADPLLGECDYGRWTGLTFEDVQAREPEAVGDWMRDPAASPHGGESVLDLLARVGVWLDAQAASSGRIVAVTHASVIRAAIVHAIGASAHSFWRIDVAPLSLTRLSGHGGRWTLAALGPLPAGRSRAPERGA